MPKKPQRLSRQTCIRMPAEWESRIAKAAGRQGMDPATWIRAAIIEKLEGKT